MKLFINAYHTNHGIGKARYDDALNRGANKEEESKIRTLRGLNRFQSFSTALMKIS